MKKFLLILALSSSAHAYTGNELAAGLRLIDNPDRQLSAREAADFGQALGFVLGVSALADARLPTVCLPRGVTFDQQLRVIRKFMADNPALLHHSGEAVVEAALGQVFKCPDAPRGTQL